MHAMIRTCIALAALAFAAPLSAQQPPDPGFNSDAILALKGLQLLDHRLNAIGYRLIAANASFCEPKIAQSGLLLHDIDQYPDQALARFALGIDGLLAVNAVAPDSPAEKAGLLAGDTILAINGVKIEDIPLDDPALAKQPLQYRRIAAVNDQMDKALARGDVTLDILRGGEQSQVTVESRPACPSRFQITVSADRSASANGEIVSVSSGMAEYFLDDS